MELLEAIDQGALYPFRTIAEITALRPLLIALYYLGHPFVLLAILLLAVICWMARKQPRPALLPGRSLTPPSTSVALEHVQ